MGDSHLKPAGPRAGRRRWSSVSFGDDVHLGVWETGRAYAREHGVTMSSLVIDALAHYLTEVERTGTRRADR